MINLSSNKLEIDITKLVFTQNSMNLYEKIFNNFINEMDIINSITWLFSHFVHDSKESINIIISSPIFKKMITIFKEQKIKNEILKIICWFFGYLVKGIPLTSILEVNNLSIFLF